MKVLIVCVVIGTTLVGHYVLNVQHKLDQQDTLLKLADQRAKLQNDEVQDLIAALQEANQKNQTARTEGYVNGVVSAIKHSDHYQAVWHDGYDRGSAVQEDMKKVALDVKYPEKK